MCVGRWGKILLAPADSHLGCEIGVVKAIWLRLRCFQEGVAVKVFFIFAFVCIVFCCCLLFICWSLEGETCMGS